MNYSELSKEVSYALRHAPWEYELEMDENGDVPLEQLLSSLHLTSKWEHLTEKDLMEMIEISEKKRHEIYDGKIKAFYRHSIPMKIIKEDKMPPEFLFHGNIYK
ncbi:RNA 2'-phosphotransferase [Lacrimispora sp.]|jgi:putative RNA 2'-phosphotransferase|uniref:RNA 2'-phosphotransferase n=1 Tax=Lacrimispora sp. TaxID=2719234 RepID=UPI002F4154C3